MEITNSTIRAIIADRKAKMVYLHEWIEEHGTPSQRERQATGLLHRDESIAALADATFANFPLRAIEVRCCKTNGCTCQSWYNATTAVQLSTAECDAIKSISCLVDKIEVRRLRLCPHPDEPECPCKEICEVSVARVAVEVGPFTVYRTVLLA